VPIHPTGTPLPRTSLDGNIPAACFRCTLGMSTSEGAMLFTVRPRAAYSRASAFVADALLPSLAQVDYLYSDRSVQIHRERGS
jgi:hypothetical protein